MAAAIHWRILILAPRSISVDDQVKFGFNAGYAVMFFQEPVYADLHLPGRPVVEHPWPARPRRRSSRLLVSDYDLRFLPVLQYPAALSIAPVLYLRPVGPLRSNEDQSLD